jgi:N-acetyltransferase
VDPASFRAPVTLRGRYVELVPLVRSYRVELHAAARDPETGRFLVDGPGSTLEEVDALIDLILGFQSKGEALAFTIVRAPDRAAVGMTRYLNIDRPNETVEIGGTWLDSSLWRTPANTEAKYLMLQHAFEVEKAHRVQFSTDLRNERSQRAIARLGARREGVTREHRRLRSGYWRSSVVYSVLVDEWPRVKTRLEGFLERPWPPAPSRPA